MRTQIVRCLNLARDRQGWQELSGSGHPLSGQDLNVDVALWLMRMLRFAAGRGDPGDQENPKADESGDHHRSMHLL
jgi:hypothetical protein